MRYSHGEFDAAWDAYERDGYAIFENILAPEKIAELKAALTPYLDANISGRNDFEGLKTNRVYALPAKSPVFAELSIHPLALAFAEKELGKSCLLSACLAIQLHPGETVQPWHHDDSHIDIPRPHDAFGVSAFWALDDTTEENGATEILPGSHLWPDQELQGAVRDGTFADTLERDVSDDPGARHDALKVVMPAGALMIAKGTLWHRGGANTSNASRLIITPQYCIGWARQLENMIATMTSAQAADLPPRMQELLGYSIHPPFMGYVDGVHPKKQLGL